MTPVRIFTAFETIRQAPLCVVLYMIYVAVIVSSLILGMWWSIWKKDVGAGFTLVVYVAGVGTALLMPLQERHNKVCNC